MTEERDTEERKSRLVVKKALVISKAGGIRRLAMIESKSKAAIRGSWRRSRSQVKSWANRAFILVTERSPETGLEVIASVTVESVIIAGGETGARIERSREVGHKQK